MGSKKTTTTQQNQYGWQQMPDNPDIAALRAEVNKPIQVDPSLQYIYANRKKDLESDITNPFGNASQYSPEMQNAMRYAGRNEIDQQYGQASKEAYSAAEQNKMNQRYALAGLTAPQLVQTGGTTIQKKPYNWGSLFGQLIGGGQQLGSAAIAAGGI